MGLPEVASWYQKKIGTYDKQQWEKTIEQRILHGLTHIPMKTTKLKTDFIDVDLVRGSSFPKAKPKHGFATVARLGTLRLMLLPLFSRWWVKQTSPRIFAILLLLYLLQLFTIAVTVCNTSDDSNEHISTSEIFIPVTMMLLLSIIHSQIVSTNPGPDKSFPEQKSRKTRKRRRLRHRLLAATNKTSQDMCLDTSRYQLSSKDSISSGYKKVKICTDENGIITINRINKYDVPVLSSLQSGESSKDDVKIAQAENELIEDNVEKSCEMIKNKQSMQPPSLLVTDEQQQQQQPEVVQEPLALDDDGFESLNGNVSSENGEEPFLETLQTQNLSDDVFNLPSNSSTPIKIHPSTSKCKKICKTWVDDVCNAQNSDSGLHHRKSATDYVCSSPEHESETDTDTHLTLKNVPITKLRNNEPEKCRTTQTLQIPVRSIESSGCDSEEEGDCDNLSSPGTGSFSPLHADATTSATEWMGVTTNSEDCTYSSEYDESDSQSEFNSNNDQSFAWDFDLSPTAILSPSCAPSDRVSCTIWERHDIKKADLSVLDISSTIIEKVEAMPESLDYFYGGVVLSVLLSLVPAIFRLGETVSDPHYVSDNQHKLCISEFFLFQQVPNSVYSLLELCLGSSVWERSVMIIAIVQRCILGVLFFFLLAVAERTFKQRFLYAKLFSHLTSSRRARKSNLPHFRLNKVRNIKTWLSVRSYLKKRGPQRSVDVIVSAAFIITLILLSFISMEFLRDSVSLHSRYNLEAVLWSLAIGIYLLRFMTIGTKINRKYRNLSVLITEQINLYLQIEQKPHKKDELMVANSVLKLAADLLKELESPFKISGLSANPYLYTITKVVILSALSGVLSEMLGFKLKLHKIKIK